MSPEENIAAVRHYYERIFNEGALDEIDQFVDPRFFNHDHPPGFTPPRGSEGALAFWNLVRTAFPDMKVAIDVILAEDDIVVEHSTITATHSGDWMGVPPTGKQITWDMSNVYKLENGKLTDRWGAFDQMAIMRQMGVMGGRGGSE